jgi:hypothetical protein
MRTNALAILVILTGVFLGLRGLLSKQVVPPRPMFHDYLETERGPVGWHSSERLYDNFGRACFVDHHLNLVVIAILPRESMGIDNSLDAAPTIAKFYGGTEHSFGVHRDENQLYVYFRGERIQMMHLPQSFSKSFAREVFRVRQSRDVLRIEDVLTEMGLPFFLPVLDES